MKAKANHTQQSAAYSSPKFSRTESENVYRLAAQGHRLALRVQEAIEVLEDCLRRYEYAGSFSSARPQLMGLQLE
jgi:hypothetical protein